MKTLPGGGCKETEHLVDVEGFRGGEQPVPGDAVLIARVRAGDPIAFGQLFDRHHGVALSVAHRHANNASDAEDLAAEGFAKVFAILRAGGGPDGFFRAYLCTTVSRLAYANNTTGNKQLLTDEVEVFDGNDEHVDPVMHEFESGVVATAFRSLPERWQAVLWYTEIDGMKPAAVAPLLGLSANGTSALAVRAREGLRQAYLQSHISVTGTGTGTGGGGCAAAAGQLGAFARSGLSARNTEKVREHLEACPKCTGILLQLDDVGMSMRGIIAPLFLGSLGVYGGSIAAGSLTGAPVLPGAAGNVASGIAGGTGATTTAGGATAGAAGTGGIFSGVLGGVGSFVGANTMATMIVGVGLLAATAGVAATVLGGPVSTTSRPAPEASGPVFQGHTDVAPRDVPSGAPTGVVEEEPAMLLRPGKSTEPAAETSGEQEPATQPPPAPRQSASPTQATSAPLPEVAPTPDASPSTSPTPVASRIPTPFPSTAPTPEPTPTGTPAPVLSPEPTLPMTTPTPSAVSPTPTPTPVPTLPTPTPTLPPTPNPTPTPSPTEPELPRPPADTGPLKDKIGFGGAPGAFGTATTVEIDAARFEGDGFIDVGFRLFDLVGTRTLTVDWAGTGCSVVNEGKGTLALRCPLPAGTEKLKFVVAPGNGELRLLNMELKHDGAKGTRTSLIW